MMDHKDNFYDKDQIKKNRDKKVIDINVFSECEKRHHERDEACVVLNVYCCNEKHKENCSVDINIYTDKE